MRERQTNKQTDVYIYHAFYELNQFIQEMQQQPYV